MKYALLFSLLFTTGCAEMNWHRPILGTRVHRFSAGGKDFVHCSILMDAGQPQLAHDAIEVCRDEVGQPVTPAARQRK